MNLPDSIIIEAALNGGRSRAEHPGVPATPWEVAAEARRCAEAGASVVHIHAQDADGGWRVDPAWYTEAHLRIREAAPGTLISITSIRPSDVPVAAVLDLLDALAVDADTRPDLISINLGHIVAWQRGRTLHFPNDYADIVALLTACRDHGIIPELGVMDLGFVSNAVALRDAGLIADGAWFLLELDSPAWGAGRQVAPATPANHDALAAALREHFPASVWAAHGAGVATWAIVERAVARGEHVRVGLEDALHLPGGEPALDNAQQVQWTASRARLLGREPATPEQARAIIAGPHGR